jgi:hypothetical protein
MKFTLVINCDNEAFQDNENVEVSSILAHISDRILKMPYFSEGHSQPLRLPSGQEVGYFDITKGVC